MQNIIVTGSSTGIGNATVEMLARAGHRVFATMRNVNDGTPLLKMAEEENLQIEVLALDVANEASVNRAFEEIYQRIDRVDALVCNAGVLGIGSVEETPMSVYYNCFEVNFFGAVRCVKEVLPGMRERGKGCIVMISSIVGLVASSPNCAYSPSKFAIEAFSEALAQEAKTFGIRVAVVEPGGVATSINDKAAKAVPQQSRYPSIQRLAKLFEQPGATTMGMPVENVAGVIINIIEGDNWQFRYLIGEDAEMTVKMRNSVSDEEWVHLHSLEGDAFDRAMGELSESISHSDS